MIAIIATVLIAFIVGLVWACAIVSVDYDDIEEKEREDERDN